MILGGGVAVCLLLSAHRTVIFAIAQLSCCVSYCLNFSEFNCIIPLKVVKALFDRYFYLSGSLRILVLRGVCFFLRRINTVNQSLC